MTYLLKDRHGTYYFRRVVPPHLRPFMPPPWRGKANFKRSLGTKKPTTAKIEASKALRECTVAFQIALRTKDGTPEEGKMTADVHPITIADIESDVIAEVLAADDAEREEGDDRRRLQTTNERKLNGLTSFPSRFRSARVWRRIPRSPMAIGLSQLHDEYQTSLRTQRHEHHRRGVEALSEEEGFAD